MKKLFAMLTSAVVLTACAFSFAACGDDTPKHTHDYGTQWVTNSTHHWHECKNDGCDQKEKDKAAHLDNDNNGKCDTCDDTMSVKIPVASVELSQTEITLEVDGTATLTAAVTPDNATNKTVTWESDKTNIATVDKNGKVTAIAQGTAKITATADGKSANCTVTVTAKPVPVTGIELDKTAITLEIDETQTLTATLAPDNATDKTVTWTVAPSGVVSVENGVITALKDGTATVTATANGKSATCSVTVNAPVTNSDIITALDTYCKKGVVIKGLGLLEINHDNVKNGKWYITTNADGKITGAEYTFYYDRKETQNMYYAIGKVEFETPINAKDLVAGNFENATYSEIYKKNYIESNQPARQELTNAICEKVFETNGTVIGRYMVDNGFAESDSILSGTIRMFTVIEVTDKGVQEADVNIKTSSNDAEYISKLNNENDYRVYEKVSAVIMGNFVDNNSEPFFGNSAD